MLMRGAVNMSKQKENHKGKKGGRAVILICVFVIVILLTIVVHLLLDKKEDEPKRNVVVNSDNVDEVLENLEDPVPLGSYEVTMNSTWNFASGDVASENAYVENAKTNTNSVYFDVTRIDTGETIYESPILPVGTHLENIALDSNLPNGSYDCLITYHLLDDEEKSISKVKLTLTIRVGH